MNVDSRNFTFTIRPYVSADLEQAIELFTRTVHTVSAAYYSSEETEAWAPSNPDPEIWRDFFSKRYILVAESNGEIVGFGCLGPDGSTVDMLFSHQDHQSEGLGSAVLDALEAEAEQCGVKEISLTTSATAWPFYRKRGYDYRRSEKKTYGSVVFDCQILSKVLPVFPEIRRKDRILNIDSATKLLENGEYGYLSMCAVNGYGYGIPISYAYTGKSIYFHCAPEGFKLENIRQNDRVSFCVVGRTLVIPGQFSTAYESVLVFGHITDRLSDEERHEALRLLVRKYSPDHIEISEKYIEKSFHRTHILRLDIEHLSAKSKAFPAHD